MKDTQIQRYILFGIGVVLILLLLFPLFDFVNNSSNARRTAG